jgi:multidrug efflux pump subunit AcrA (membrane-fusion protein)
MQVPAYYADAPIDLHSGDLLAFAGDAPHLYRTGPEAADVTVVIASPSSAERPLNMSVSAPQRISPVGRSVCISSRLGQRPSASGWPISG